MNNTATKQALRSLGSTWIGFRFGLGILVALLNTASAQVAAQSSLDANVANTLGKYCFECHDGDISKGQLNLERILHQEFAKTTIEWERVLRQLQARQMPPVDKQRPSEPEYAQLVSSLAAPLDQWAAKNPKPGTTDTFRRLTRLEYRNAIRDLLALEIDAASLLPKDDAGHGFDHIASSELSPSLLERYLAAAQKISRWAIGSSAKTPEGETWRIPPDVTQEDHVEGLPLGTRGGAQFHHHFPRDGQYEIQIRLTRDRNEEIEGLREAHELVVLLDREQVQQFTVKPPDGHKNFELVDAHLRIRLPIRAGPRTLGVTFIKNPSALPETKRQPYNARFNMHRHPRMTPAIFQVTATGPYEDTSPGDTPSRRRIFTRQPKNADDELPTAKSILRELVRRAYRREVTNEDLEKPLKFYQEARKDSGFEGGIEAALAAIIASPEFLFRIEQTPPKLASGHSYPLPPTEVATRLSLFLWGSIPDDQLLDLAIGGQLAKAEILEQQTRRMLKDSRSRHLSQSFAAQWLHLRNLDSFTPDLRLYPDFDDNLRQSFRAETELFFENIVHEDRSILDLLRARDTFLNERLARHYGIPHVQGSQFRRVTLEGTERRGGLLRHGSVLTVTSLATRTSPVLRGNWILGNLLGNPAPPPPTNVPALTENTVSATLPLRNRLAAHRAQPACAHCHDLMDPIGFALENYDAIGRWRNHEEGLPLDTSGRLPDGRTFNSIDGLEQGLLARPDQFASALTEKLLTFALGRRLESFDAPTVREIVHNTSKMHYKFSEIVVGITRSVPFTLRTSP